MNKLFRQLLVEFPVLFSMRGRKTASDWIFFSCLFVSFDYRFSPTRAPAPWDGIRISDTYSPVCPQRLPNIQNETAALEKMPKGRLEYLKRLLPHLENQSEDCLYLNIFSPINGEYNDTWPHLIAHYAASFFLPFQKKGQNTSAATKQR